MDKNNKWIMHYVDFQHHFNDLKVKDILKIINVKPHTYYKLCKKYNKITTTKKDDDDLIQDMCFDPSFINEYLNNL